MYLSASEVQHLETRTDYKCPVDPSELRNCPREDLATNKQAKADEGMSIFSRKMD
jgi:hypothetical protein